MSPYVSNSISIFNEGPKMPSQPKAGQTFDESRSDFSALDFQQRTSPISTSYSPIKILSSNFFLNGSPMLETLEGSHSKDPTGPTSTFENPTYFLDADRKATKILSNNGLSQITENEDDENLDYQGTTEKKKNSVDSSEVGIICGVKSLRNLKKNSCEGLESEVKRRTSLEFGSGCGKKKNSEEIIAGSQKLSEEMFVIAGDLCASN